LILPQRYRNDSTSSSSSNERTSYRAGGNWEYEQKYRNDSSRGTSSSSYPVVSTQPVNDEFRPKKETEIKRVNGQYYCEPCDSYTNTYDVMQAHLSGKSHKKKTKQIVRFACDLCLIDVSSQETLQTHYQGMAHIKRAKVAEDAKREAENPMKVSLNEKEELADLRQRCKKLERQNTNLQKEVDQLLKFKKNCLANHHNIKTEKVQKSESSDPYRNDGTIVLL